MGSDGFTVDLDVLRTARDRVDRLAKDLMGPSRDVPNAEVFGHTQLAEAVTVFAAREERGLEGLAGEAQSIERGLSETINSYQKMDKDSAARFKGSPHEFENRQRPGAR